MVVVPLNTTTKKRNLENRHTQMGLCFVECDSFEVVAKATESEAIHVVPVFGDQPRTQTRQTIWIGKCAILLGDRYEDCHYSTTGKVSFANWKACRVSHLIPSTRNE